MRTMPAPRGPLSGALIDALGRNPHSVCLPAVGGVADPVADEDLQLALYLCYELHYRGLPGAADDWEWEPSLLQWRAGLERAFEAALREAVPRRPGIDAARLDAGLRTLADADGPSLSAFVRTRAGVTQLREFMVHRSAYQLKEADPHSWAIPRLSGVPKAALIEIQADEYGGGRPDWMHAALFGRAMRAVGLDDTYGAYLHLIPGVTLATVNAMSLFGLHRRLRGAIVGHLALFEMTSSLPNRRYADAVRRLGFGPDATLFFDEHVTADAVHENIAAVDLAGGLIRQEPGLAADVLWGAEVLAMLDARWAAHVLGAWRHGASSLRGALGPEAARPATALVSS